MDGCTFGNLDGCSSRLFDKVSRLKGVLIYLAGVKHVAGDMFKSVPKGDAIFLKVKFVSFWHCSLLLLVTEGSFFTFTFT